MSDRYSLLVHLLCEYTYRLTCRYESDLVQLRNNVSLRLADPVDHLEFIMASVRCSVADQVEADIHKIIDIVQLGEYNTDSTN